jgi:DNA gyrase subunit B
MINKDNKSNVNPIDPFEKGITGKKEPVNQSDYSAKNIKVLKGLESVRTVPGMYIGDVEGIDGLNRMVYEVIDNAVDEHIAGYGQSIDILIEENGFMTIKDHGRGLPVDKHETEGIPAMEVIMTQLHAGGKFDKDTYEFSTGLHGLGVSIVTALSERLEVISSREGKKFYMSFESGVKKEDMKEVGFTSDTGTEIKFLPDKKIFKITDFCINSLKIRFEEICFLNSGLRINLTDQRTNLFESFFYEGGIKEYLTKNLKTDSNILDEILYVKEYYMPNNGRRLQVEAAFLWNNSFQENIKAYTNTIYQDNGGSHEVGFKTCISNVLINYMERTKRKSKIELCADDTRGGLLGIIAIRIANPSFTSQTKNKLSSLVAKHAVEHVVGGYLSAYIDHNPKKAKILEEKIEKNAELRQKLKDVRSSAKLDGKILPRVLLKVVDCQRNNNLEKELFLVEGQSAGSGVKGGRDSTFQAVFMLRGKILNVEKATIDAILNFEEIRDLFSVLGGGFGDVFDVTKLRYDRVFIMTDADIDGEHIRTLLLTLFFRYAPDLIRHGRLYIGQPPLYKIEYSKKTRYIKDQEEMNKVLVEEFEKEYLGKDNDGNDIILVSYVASAQHLRNSFKKKFIFNYFDLLSFLLSKNINVLNNVVSFDSEKWVKDILIPILKEYKEGNWSFKHIGDQIELMLTNSIEKLVYLLNTQEVNLLFSEGLYKLLFPIKIFYKDKEPVVCHHLLEFLTFFDKVTKKGLYITRYKGLGEMDAEELHLHVLDPKGRVLKQVVMSDESEVLSLVPILMGKDVKERKVLIEKEAYKVESLDI